MGDPHDKIEEINARFSAMGQDAKVAQGVSDVDINDKVLSAIANFSSESIGQFKQARKKSIKVKEAIGSVSESMIFQYRDEVNKVHKGRPAEFYNKLTIQDNWKARMEVYDKAQVTFDVSSDEE
ncbi:MAG: hypothetical protein Q9191_004343 [Dirinaria sp. TL-2023a]